MQPPILILCSLVHYMDKRTQQQEGGRGDQLQAQVDALALAARDAARPAVAHHLPPHIPQLQHLRMTRTPLIPHRRVGCLICAKAPQCVIPAVHNQKCRVDMGLNSCLRRWEGVECCDYVPSTVARQPRQPQHV